MEFIDTMARLSYLNHLYAKYKIFLKSFSWPSQPQQAAGYLFKNKWVDPALFISKRNSRLREGGMDRIIIAHAQSLRLHNPRSDRLEDHFTSHCFRHWFVTHLIRAGMPRDFVKKLRGDARYEAINIYNRIDKKELCERYLAHIPQLGI
jgi:integrase/recombinase XerD